jgi:hypothetical protein
MLSKKKFGALPYQHTPQKKLKAAMSMITKHFTSRGINVNQLSFVDLGSGAGEAVIEAKRAGFLRSSGVEINPTLLLLSYFNAARSGYLRSVSFTNHNLLTLPLQKYNCVFMFGVKPLLEVMSPKLETEVAVGNVICLYRFKLGTKLVDTGKFQVVGRDGELTLYERVGGDSSGSSGDSGDSK